MASPSLPKHKLPKLDSVFSLSFPRRSEAEAPSDLPDARAAHMLPDFVRQTRADILAFVGMLRRDLHRAVNLDRAWEYIEEEDGCSNAPIDASVADWLIHRRCTDQRSRCLLPLR